MRDSHRRQMVREFSRRWKRVEVDLWQIYKWADMQGFPSQSGGGAGGQVGTHSDPVGDKATAAASDHYDDPSIKAAKEADAALYRIMRDLATLEYAISTAKAPHVMSEKDKEKCGGCGTFRFEKPQGWTLGFCNSCYVTERRKVKRRKK